MARVGLSCSQTGVRRRTPKPRISLYVLVREPWKLRRAGLILALASIGLLSSFAPAAKAAFLFDFAPQNSFSLVNTNADGSVIVQSNSIMLTGGNNGGGDPGTTDFVATAVSSGTLAFNWSYSTLDLPGFDFAGFILNGNFCSLAQMDGDSGTSSSSACNFHINTGQSFGFRVGTADNQGEPGILTVTAAATSAVPEPGTASTLLLVTGITVAARRRRQAVNQNRGNQQ
jgi:hypothetical protein